MKRIVVIVAGATGEPHDLTIEAGTSASDILNELGLQGHQLSKDNGTDVFGPDENVYTAVPDGAKLYATSQPVVGELCAAARH